MGSNAFADRNSESRSRPWYRAEQRVQEALSLWVSRHGAPTSAVARWGCDRADEDIHDGEIRRALLTETTDRSDFLVVPPNWQGELATVRFAIEVKAARLKPHKGWVLTESALRHARKQQDDLTAAYVDALGPLPSGISGADVAPRCFFALVNQFERDPYVALVTLAMADRIKVRTRLGYDNGEFGWLLRAEDLAGRHWTRLDAFRPDRRKRRPTLMTRGDWGREYRHLGGPPLAVEAELAAELVADFESLPERQPPSGGSFDRLPTDAQLRELQRLQEAKGWPHRPAPRTSGEAWLVIAALKGSERL
jgi:hypothetical protein